MKPEDFTKLIERKFGTKRGTQWRAAQKLNIAQGNLSSMMNGRITVPQKHIAALVALPDYAPPSGIDQEIYEGDGVLQLITTFTARLTPDAAKYLEIAVRFHTSPSFKYADLGASEDATSNFFERILKTYVECIHADHPSMYAAIMRVMRIEKEEEARQFSLELHERRHLVADELSANELSADDDIDPLA